MINPTNKRLLCELVDYTCELCHKKCEASKLDIHRLRRGNVGGTYEHRNCQVLCKSCHKLIHGNEFNRNY